jgi:tetratricopeptide (TPR) repeat protein
MNANRSGDPPHPGTPATAAELAEQMRELRRWAGQLSLRRLRQLGGTQRATDGGEIDALPESTTSYVLRGSRPASAQFVRAFVAACLRARQLDPEGITEHLARWHEAWLHATGERPSTPAPPATGPAPPGPAPPRQLPADVGGFTGRATELAILHALTPTSAPAPPAVAVIAGTAGVGKTALAIHAAHHLAEHYPHGQLFIDLHGFTAGVAPVEPTGVLDRLLRALGVPGEQIPATLEDRAALWRTVLAGRRTLVVLDNAATEQQVAPLLPGESGCLVLVTSRRRLTGLDAIHPVPLDVLPPTDALALFHHVAGGRHRTPPRELAAETVELCGRLPLAIRIAASRLRSHPIWSMTDLLARLRDQNHRLAELADESGTRSVATALAVSYHQLPPDQRHLYQLLGLHPGADIDPYAAAALADTSPDQARRLLDQLLDAHLLQEPSPGRYTFHDLVRAHAAYLAAEPGPHRHRTRRARRQRVALIRLLDSYRHTASVAMDAAYPYERNRRPRVPPARNPGPDLPDPATAAAWLDSELRNLLAAARYAAGNGWPEHTCQLSAILHRHLRIRGQYQQAQALHEQALATGHRVGELDSLIGLGRVHQAQGRYRPAFDTFAAAHDIARRTGNRTGQLTALIGLGWVKAEQGWYAEALDRIEQALEIARDTGDRNGELDSLLGLGRVHQMQGRHQPALEAGTAAHDIARRTGNRTGQLNALIGLGRVHRLQGHHEQAGDDFQQALEIARDTGDRNGELNALRGLGHIHLVQGQHQQAFEVLAAALEIARSTRNGNGELGALIGLGHLHRHKCRPAQAADSYRAALRLARDTGHRNWQFEALHGLGRVHHRTGQQELATQHHERALELATELGQPVDQARAHDGLASAHRARHEHDHARQHWQRALAILTDLGSDHTEEAEVSAATIRAHLAEFVSRRRGNPPR